jgi:hypothetical protein
VSGKSVETASVKASSPASANLRTSVAGNVLVTEPQPHAAGLIHRAWAPTRTCWGEVLRRRIRPKCNEDGPSRYWPSSHRLPYRGEVADDKRGCWPRAPRRTRKGGPAPSMTSGVPGSWRIYAAAGQGSCPRNTRPPDLMPHLDAKLRDKSLTEIGGTNLRRGAARPPDIRHPTSDIRHSRMTTSSTVKTSLGSSTTTRRVRGTADGQLNASASGSHLTAGG